MNASIRNAIVGSPHRTRGWRVLWVLAGVAALAGCQTPGDRALNELNKQAGEKIALDESLSAAVKQMGHDVYLNALMLQQDGALPAPKVPITYTPEVADKTRKQAEDEHKQLDKIGDSIKGAIANYVPGGLAIVGLFGTLAGLVKNRIGSKKTFALIKGVSDFAGKTPALVNDLAGLNWKDPKDLQSAVAMINGASKDAHVTAQTAANIYHEVRADVKAHQASGEIKPIATKTMAEKAVDPADPLGQG